MTLNCQKHDSEIQKAFEKVVNSKTGNEWAIFEYEGTTNILKLGAEGGECKHKTKIILIDGGLDEFGTSFNSGRLQYGVISVRLDTNVLPKIVLVHWQGEQVPSSRTAATAVHAQDLRRHFRLIHVLHYARAEMDVEPDVIRKVVQKIVPGAANSKVLIESSYSMPTSVGSVYCPIKPHMDLSLKEREKFWQEMNREEKTRKEEEKQHQAEIIAKGVIRSGNGPKSASAPKNDSPSYTICLAPVTSNQGSSLISSSSANITDAPKILSAAISSSPQVLQSTPISKGLCAVALWDYEASDISEISFEAESLLTEIQQIDEGWWNGRSPSGKVGLFPANYVRLI